MLTTIDERTDTPPRVAFAIARNVGSAPARNRVRRRLRHLVREEADLLERGHCYLIGAAPRAAEADYENVRSDLTHLLADAGGRR